MANEISNPTAQPMMIPMDKIHEMPGVFTPRPPERSLGGLVASIQIGNRRTAPFTVLSEQVCHLLNTNDRLSGGKAP